MKSKKDFMIEDAQKAAIFILYSHHNFITFLYINSVSVISWQDGQILGNVSKRYYNTWKSATAKIEYEI